MQPAEKLRNSLCRSGMEVNCFDLSEVFRIAFTISVLFLNADIVKNQTRTKPHSSDRCSSIYKFLFEWNSGVEERNLSISNATVRLYREVINRHIPLGESVPVNISVNIQLLDSRDDVSTDSDGIAWTLVKGVEVGLVPDDWIELNVTSPFREVWDPAVQMMLVEMQIMFSVDCIRHKKVPLKVVNPATVELEQNSRRERQLQYQPFLVVFSTSIDGDAAVDDVVNEDDPTLEASSSNERNRRSVTENQTSEIVEVCHLENFSVNFIDLGLVRIIDPVVANIRQCVGSCSLEHIRFSHNLPTNHARLLASAHTLYQTQPDTLDTEPTEPCCVPVTFSSKYLLIRYSDGMYEYRLYHDFIAEECGCR